MVFILDPDTLRVLRLCSTAMLIAKGEGGGGLLSIPSRSVIRVEKAVGTASQNLCEGVDNVGCHVKKM